MEHLLSLPTVNAIAGKTIFLFAYGHEAVVAFFVLSGLVNRMALSRRQYGCRELLYSRGIRLLPVYFVVVAGSCLAQAAIDHEFPWRQLLGHVFFVATLHGEVARTLHVNTAQWSMSSEVFFYVCLAACVAARSRMAYFVWAAVSCAAIMLMLSGAAILGALWYSGQPLRRTIPLRLLH